MSEWKNVTSGDPATESAGLNGSVDGAKPSGGVSLLDILLLLLERKWFLLVSMLVICAASVILSVFVLESEYTATAVVLPSKGKGGSPLSSMVGDLPISGLLKNLDMFGQGNNSRFLSILDSRRLADKVIAKFDLVHHYGYDKKKKWYIETLLKEYHKNLDVTEDQLDNIRIAVTDTSPTVAAEMANYIVSQLDSISFQISRSDAQGSRMFFEERKALMQKDLDSVHHAFADFQIKHNIIDMEQQVKSSIEALAGVEAEAMAADLEKEMLSSSFGFNSRMQEAAKKKQVLDKRLKGYMDNGSGSLVLALRKTPELGIQYAYLYRDVKVHETLYAFILQMYEQAKFQEANNSPTVSILESADIPQKRTRPKRAVICILGFFIGLIGTSIWVLVAHWYKMQRMRRSDVYVKLQKVLKQLRSA